MKKIAFGFACGFSAVFLFVLMLASYGRITRQTETDIALSQAIDTALSGTAGGQNKNRTDGNDRELIADFLKRLLVQANSDSALTVSVLEADAAHGILSVEMTEEYRHPNGKEGTVSNVRTVIFDKPAKQKQEVKTVRFYVDGSLYKEYEIKKDAFCIIPAAPTKDGRRFLCWRFQSGGTGDAQSVNVPGANGSRRVIGQGGVPYAVGSDAGLTAVFE